MGSDRFYPEEAPTRRLHVKAFEIERYPVTNRQFAAFAQATGYVTVAERAPVQADLPRVATQVEAGGMVFTPTAGPVSLAHWDLWWRWEPGASWRHPEGPGTNTDGREDHPVVLVAYADARAYAQWAGRDLPTEVEHECAARGGSDEATYAWGEELHPGGRLMANTWQGRFPYLNTGAHGWRGTSPVGELPPNGYQVFDLIGNVWEWTKAFYLTGPDRDVADRAARESGRPEPGDGPGHGPACCSPRRTSSPDLISAATVKGEGHPRRVLKGGSHLCAPEYCIRYRPAARSAQSEDTATTHTGFRCVVRHP